METFGERLRRLRLVRGISQSELAERIGAPYRFQVSEWETNNHRPRRRYIKLIAQVLQVSQHYLETGEHEDMGVLRISPATAERQFFHERLRHLREGRGFTRPELAQRVDATERQIRGWESGEEPGAREVSNLARALGVTTDYLLNGREAPQLAALYRAIQIGIPRERLLMMCDGGGNV